MTRGMRMWKPAGQFARRAGLVVMIAGLVIAAAPSGLVHGAASSERQDAFANAAAEFGVPEEILLSISYNQSRWENHTGQPSADGGYGLMHLTTEVAPEDGRGDPARPLPKREAGRRAYTLDEAAKLLGISLETLKHDERHNVRGSAALLARYAAEAHNGQKPTQLEDWYTATARLADAATVESAQAFADDVYATINSGASRATADGQSMKLAPRSAEPDSSRVRSLGLPSRHQDRHSETECPRTITCKWVPARFAQNNPGDPGDYGNYDEADREQDMDIKQIVIHDTEGSYQSAIDWYQDSRSYVAAHYTIRSVDGEVTQSVKNKDVAWHAGNWYVNMHSIGIEHEGEAAEGAAWYTEAMYRSSAKLVRYLADKYDIPLDREHIVGHDQYHGINPARVPAMHWDPGPYWDWEHYMNLLHQPTVPTAGSGSKAVTIAPKFRTNKPPVTQCVDDACALLPEQSANFVYLRTEPHHDAPFLADAGLHPGGEPGTTEIQDWSAKATHGQRFAVAERQGDWTAIWFGGQKGWFHNPAWSTALPATAKLVKPKAGVTSIPIYGRPLPEASVYPPGGPPFQTIEPLQYTIPAGQSYVAYDKKAINDYYRVFAFDRSSPGDGTIVVGNEKYIPIAYNHRQAYVKASDVRFVSE